MAKSTLHEKSFRLKGNLCFSRPVFIFCTLLQWLCIIIYIKLGLGSETSLVGSPAEITVLAIQTQTMILHPIIVSKMKLKCIKL